MKADRQISFTAWESDDAADSDTEDEARPISTPQPEIHHNHHVRLRSPITEYYDSGWRTTRDGRHSHRPAIVRVRSPRRNRSFSPSYGRPRANLGVLGH